MVGELFYIFEYEKNKKVKQYKLKKFYYCQNGEFGISDVFDWILGSKVFIKVIREFFLLINIFSI